MNKKNLLKLSLISFVITICIFVFNYFFFHYFTSKGFGTVFYKEAQKPFVADLIGQLGVLFLFFSIVTLLIALVCFKKKD